MRLYRIKYVKHYGFKPTIANYYVVIGNEGLLNQFTLDEEKRASMPVYLQPVGGETLDLVTFTSIACDVPGDEIHDVTIYTDREKNNEGIH